MKSFSCYVATEVEKISKSRITDLRDGGQNSYVSARRLFWVIRDLQAVAH